MYSICFEPFFGWGERVLFLPCTLTRVDPLFFLSVICCTLGFFVFLCRNSPGWLPSHIHSLHDDWWLVPGTSEAISFYYKNVVLTGVTRLHLGLYIAKPYINVVHWMSGIILLFAYWYYWNTTLRDYFDVACKNGEWREQSSNIYYGMLRRWAAPGVGITPHEMHE